MYFLTAKSTAPADASAYFVPANVRNGRLFARFASKPARSYHFLAGPSFLGFGIGPGSFAAKRGGRIRPGQAESTEAYDRPWKRVSTAALSLGRKKTTDSPRARAGAVKSLIFTAPAQRGAGGCSAKNDMRMVWYFLPSKVQKAPRRCRGIVLTPFSAKLVQKTPADASAYFVPANVRNGRLFAGFASKPAPFLPLLAGPSFHGSGIGRSHSPRNAAGRMRPGQAESTKPTFAPKGGWGRTKRRQKNPQVAGLQTTRAAQTPPLKRTLPRAGANEKTKGPAVAGLRRSLPQRQRYPRARTAECFMYSR